MIGRRKKEPVIQRSPHLDRQKQTTFRYSSNRSQAERPLARHDTQAAGNEENSKTGRFRRFRRVPYLLGGTLLAAGALYFSFLPADPKIITAGGQEPVRNGAPYAQLVAGTTDNWLSRSKFTINRQKIANELQLRFPEISRAKVETPLFANHAIIKLEIARPVLILNNGGNSFLLDNRGHALVDIAQERTLYKTEKLPVVSDQSSTSLKAGNQALTSGQVAAILEITRQSEAKDLSGISFSLSGGAGELGVRYSRIPYIVKYNLNEDARKSFGTFYAVKEYTDRNKARPAEYIDVRVPERAYVK